MNDELDEFHKHLKECKWCREHLFVLCMDGEHLLIKAAKMIETSKDIEDEIKKSGELKDKESE